MYKIGDKVKIVNDGKVFSTYPDFIYNKQTVFNISNKQLSCWKWEREAADFMHLEYTVAHIGEHEYGGYEDLLYVVNEEAGVGFVIEQTGVELVSPVTPVSTTMSRSEIEDAVKANLTTDTDIKLLLEYLHSNYNEVWNDFARDKGYIYEDDIEIEDVPQSVVEEIREQAIDECVDAVRDVRP